MATYSKDFTGGNSGYKLYFDINEESYSIENNTSTVAWKLRIKSTKPLQYGSWDYTAPSFSVSIDGVVVRSGTKNYDFREYTELTVANGTLTINHNNDGTKNVAIYAIFGGSTTPIGRAVINDVFSLTTIPRNHAVYIWDDTSYKSGVLYVWKGVGWTKPNITTQGIYVWNGEEWVLGTLRG